MANPHNLPVYPDAEGNVHLDALHLGSFPSLLWDTMQRCNYTERPHYFGVKHADRPINKYDVTVTITDPTPQMRGPVSVTVQSPTFLSGCRTAACLALEQFCHRRQCQLYGTPAGLFPPAGGNNALHDVQVHTAQDASVAGYNATLGALTVYAEASANLKHDLLVQNRSLATHGQFLANQVRQREEQIAALHQHIHEQQEMVGNLEEQLMDAQVQIEDLEGGNEAIMNFNPPQQPMPDQDPHSGMESVPGMQFLPELSDTASVNQMLPPRHRSPCYGWISEAGTTDDDEDPEMDLDTLQSPST